MEINKRAQVFTLFAISIIVLLFLTYSVYKIDSSGASTRTRVSTMENFMGSMENTFEREMYINGYRAIFLAENYISTNGTYIPNVTSFFNGCFFNGSIFGNSSDILSGVTYGDIVSNLQADSTDINAQLTFTNPQLAVQQEDPWNVVMIFSANMSLVDNTGTVRWDKFETIKSYIPIEGFEDPIYIINSNNKVSYIINRTTNLGNNVSDILQDLNSRFYSANNDAPSFLNRLTGSLSPDTNGIESFVDLAAFSLQDLAVKDKSAVDHIYFSSQIGSGRKITGMPSWFVLDSDHISKYNVGSAAI